MASLARPLASLGRATLGALGGVGYAAMLLVDALRLVAVGWREGQPVRLTATQWRLLEVLARHAGRVVTTRQLLREVWGPGHAEQAHYLRIYVHQLRQKLEEDPGRPAFLLTETGVGYRLLLDPGGG